MINWAVYPILEPPVTKAMTDAELRALITMEVTPNVSFPKFPCHTEAVDRCMKLVTKRPKLFGFICARVASGQLMPKFESKYDFSHFIL